MFDLDFKSRKPIYEQLMEHIKLMIIQNVLEADDKLPSVRSLAKELTINPNTIQKAYRDLERDGYTYSVPGKGSFVNDMKDTIDRERIDALKTDLERIIKELTYLEISSETLKSLVNQVVLEVENHKERRSVK